MLPEKSSTPIVLSWVIIGNTAAKWRDLGGVVEDRASQARLLGSVSQFRHFKSCVTSDMSVSLSEP